MQLRLLGLLAVGAIAGFAADVSGTWHGKQTPSGSAERTFVFKQDGTKITGETSSKMLGTSAIEDGTIEDDTISFTINAKFMGQGVKLFFKGKVSGNELKINMRNDNGKLNVDFAAKKTS